MLAIELNTRRKTKRLVTRKGLMVLGLDVSPFPFRWYFQVPAVCFLWVYINVKYGKISMEDGFRFGFPPLPAVILLTVRSKSGEKTS